MAIFGKHILTKKRKQALDAFIAHAIKALEKLKKHARSDMERLLFAEMEKTLQGHRYFSIPAER
ncbi:MAG: hypothetical protein J7L44_01325 [Candidatus Diapherotrites archaeon]|nr:hypothetical protein [Candidatus Diapherotrites archaeon]